MAFTLTSSDFVHGGEIPRQCTCEGSDASPKLAWRDAPQGTKTFALIVDDADSPDPAAPKTPYVHWVLYNIPASATSLPPGATFAMLPPGTREGINDWKRAGYGGPCPRIGRHRYFFKLYALKITLDDLGAPSKLELEQAMTGAILAQAELMGTYIKDTNR